MDRKRTSGSPPGSIEINEQFAKALRTMEETSRNVFITGKAGTGKSTLLEYFRDRARKSLVVLAPTGVAALNVKGQTIHSFFRFKPNITPDTVKKTKGQKIYKEVQTIVIDEISMVRADLLDCIDRFLRMNGKNRNLPFGGTQMIMIGDLYQLPPVVTGKERELFNSRYPSPYFFDADVFHLLDFDFVDLEKIYRQKDSDFISLLNSIRNNSIDPAGLKKLNEKVHTDFEPEKGRFFISLTSTNRDADEINQKRLEDLKPPLRQFQGRIQGNFEEKNLPTSMELCLKRGAQVMLLNNDSEGRWVNGSIGKIISLSKKNEKDPVILVELSEGGVVEVEPYRWDLIRFSYDKESKAIESEVEGSFTQFPIRLAWAVTIHKSQGKTFDRVIIDIGRGTFASGQVYVALSRCTSFDGIVLKRPIQKHHVLMDWRIVKFMTSFQYRLSEKNLPFDEKIRTIQMAIEKKESLKIVYLKTSDEKSRREVTPQSVVEMEYKGKPFVGMEGYCHERREIRVFRVDRILEIE